MIYLVKYKIKWYKKLNSIKHYAIISKSNTTYDTIVNMFLYILLYF